jgi:hypothetical protein
MRYYGREDGGVAIPEGGGFIGTLNVYHELHCIVCLLFYPIPLAQLIPQNRNASTNTATKNTTGPI